MTPGELLTLIMKKHNLSSYDLADETGVSQMTISRMKRDAQNLNYDVLKILRLKYKVDINQFFEYKRQSGDIPGTK